MVLNENKEVEIDINALQVQLLAIMMQIYSLQWKIWVKLPILDQIIENKGKREILKLF